METIPSWEDEYQADISRNRGQFASQEEAHYMILEIEALRARLDEIAAAQPQGEPVAVDAVIHGGKLDEYDAVLGALDPESVCPYLSNGEAAELVAAVRTLQARQITQPAPVAAQPTPAELQPLPHTVGPHIRIMPLSTNYTPTQALQMALRFTENLEEVIVVGQFQPGEDGRKELYVSPSKMPISMAVWIHRRLGFYIDENA